MIRRDFVKAGAGAVMGIPMAQQSFGAAAAGGIVGSKKLLVIATQLGFYEPFFNPTNTDLSTSKLGALLADHHEDITWFKDLQQPEIGHGHSKGAGLLTCNRKHGSGVEMSIDQVAVEHMKQTTRFKSLNFAGKGTVWDKYSKPVHSLESLTPDEIHKLLFTSDPAKTVQLKKKLEMMKSLKKSASTSEVASYEHTIHQLEKEMEIAVEWANKPIPSIREIDTGLHLSDAHKRGYILPAEQHFELMAMALEYGRAQIIVTNAPWIDKTTALDVGKSYHGAGHGTSAGEVGAEEKLWKIESYIFDAINKMFHSMKKSKTFDDTVVMVVGGFNDAGNHRRQSVPVMVAGGGLKHQGLVDCDKPVWGQQARLSHLYLSVLHQLGVDVGDFAGDKGNFDNWLL